METDECDTPRIDRFCSCASDCDCPTGHVCNLDTMICTAGVNSCEGGSCGDRIVQRGELCDDANDDPADGCHRCISSGGVLWEWTHDEHENGPVAIRPDGSVVVAPWQGGAIFLLSADGELSGAWDGPTLFGTDRWIADIAVTEAGELYLTGWRTTASRNVCWLAKLDAAFEPVWQRGCSAAAGANSAGREIALVPGGVVVGGEVDDLGFLLKVDAAGGDVWYVPDVGAAGVLAVAADASGLLAASGYQEVDGESRGWAALFDGTTRRWQAFTPDESSIARAWSVALLGDGTVQVAGWVVSCRTCERSGWTTRVGSAGETLSSWTSPDVTNAIAAGEADEVVTVESSLLGEVGYGELVASRAGEALWRWVTPPRQTLVFVDVAPTVIITCGRRSVDGSAPVSAPLVVRAHVR